MALSSRILILVLMAAIACVPGCNRKEGGKEGSPQAQGAGGGGGGAGPGGPKGPRKFNVQTDVVRTQQVNYEIESVGELVEMNRYRLPAEVEGVAEGVGFSEGDLVTTGQELCRINFERNSLRVEEARNAVLEQEATVKKMEAELADTQRRTSTSIETSRVDFELAQREFDRVNRLKQGQLVSSEERDTVKSKFEKANAVYRDAVAAVQTQLSLAVASLNQERAALQSERARLKIAEDDLNKARIRAPIAGTILERSVTNGQFLKVGDPVAVMVQTDPLRLRFSVPESKSARLSERMQIKFRVSAYGDREFVADVYDVGKVSDPETHEVPVWARVQNDEGILRPGYFAQVALVAQTRDNSVVVPLGSVLPSEAGFVAFVVQDGTAVRRKVKTGLNITGDSIEIVDGLEPGEQLVVEGAESLQDGVPVQVISRSTASPDQPASATRAVGGAVRDPATGGGNIASDNPTSMSGTTEPKGR